MRSVILVLLCAFLLAGCTELLFGPGPPAPCSGSPIKLAFSPDGKTFAVAYPSELCIYDANGSVRGMLSLANYSFSDFAWMPDGRIVAAQSPDCPEVMTAVDGGYVNAPSPDCHVTDYLVTFWSADSNKSLHSVIVPGGSQDYMTLTASSQGQVAMSYSYFNDTASSYSQGVYAIDGRNYEFIKNITTDGNTESSYSPDGKYLKVGVTGFDVFDYTFYSTDNYAPIYDLSNTTIYSLLWSSDGKNMVGLSKDYPADKTALVLFSIQQTDNGINLTSPETFPLAYDLFGFRSAKISPDNRHVAIEWFIDLGCPGTEDFNCRYGTMDVLDIQTQKVVFHDDGGQIKGSPSYFDWSPDGELAYLFSGEGISDLKIVGAANFTGAQ